MKRASFVIALMGVLCVAGCPTDPQSGQSITEVAKSQIPPGTYTGAWVSVGNYYVNGELADELSDSGPSMSVTFSENGIPLDVFSGEPERPGLSGTFEFGGFTVTEVTLSVTAAANRVTVKYEDTVLYIGIPGYGDVTMQGYSDTVYTLLSDGSVEYMSTMYVASEFLEDFGYLSFSMETSATLSR